MKIDFSASIIHPLISITIRKIGHCCSCPKRLKIIIYWNRNRIIICFIFF